MPCNFPALPGFYQALFLYFEPLSTVSPAFLVWLFPGSEWFYEQLIPAGTPSGAPDARTMMVIWQLGNCYMLLGLISSLVFRAIRDTLPNNPEAQERILGASMTALALADVTHIIVSWVGLPENLRYSFGSWNSMTHGNITFVVFLLSAGLVYWYWTTAVLLWQGSPKEPEAGLRVGYSQFKDATDATDGQKM